MTNTTIERVEYAGWPNCYRIANGDIELVVTSDIGPRVMRCGFKDGQNLFAEMPYQLGKSGESEWQIRGGHRLWTAPETVPDSYALDNSPVKVTLDGDFISLLQPIEPETQLRKEISIRVENSGEVVVTHRIENTGPKPRVVSAWALTVMAPGGVALATFPPRGTHGGNLLPTNPLVMWAYTNFSDPRWKFTRKHLMLRQDASMPAPQKAGLYNDHTFACYLLNGDLFVKRSEANRRSDYPDFHCSCEIFTNDQFLEVETLGAMVEVKPDSSIAHVEHWFVYRNIHLQSLEEPEVDRVIGPIIEATAKAVLTVG